MKDALAEMTETALRIKRENEMLLETQKEAKRLLRACNTQDRADVALTLKLLTELFHATVH